ncbi:hypothetical protein LWI28_019665 [Acer negundo]|uniref:Uncharacterized protein n=1 Tax=Acer negundo TaxID=4023 RepID=A0AAD5NRW1_ACENE|nr:hypothetical protein LWI28_019665 [Acer negundo]
MGKGSILNASSGKPLTGDISVDDTAAMARKSSLAKGININEEKWKDKLPTKDKNLMDVVPFTGKRKSSVGEKFEQSVNKKGKGLSQVGIETLITSDLKVDNNYRKGNLQFVKGGDDKNEALITGELHVENTSGKGNSQIVEEKKDGNKSVSEEVQYRVVRPKFLSSSEVSSMVEEAPSHFQSVGRSLPARRV